MGRYITPAADPIPIISRPPTAIVGSTNTAGNLTANWGVAASDTGVNIRFALSGALTSATYKEIVSITGAGVLTFAGCSSMDATIRDLAIKVLVDGVQLVERTLTGINGGSRGPVAVGSAAFDSTNSHSVFVFDQIVFSASLSIQIKSSLTETDLVRAWYSYRTV